MKLMRSPRTELWSWPFDEQLTQLRNDLNRIFESDKPQFSEFFNTWSPRLDLLESKDDLVVRVELPGMAKEDIDISLHLNSLSISGEKKPVQTEGTVSRAERFFGKFHRALELPKPVATDKVKAEYKDGLLTVTLPKTDEAKPRQIEVQLS